MLELHRAKQVYVFPKFFSASINLLVINAKLYQKIFIKKVVKVVNPIFLFISSFLDLIPKYNRSFSKIYHFFYLKSSLVNNCIAIKAFVL